MVKFVGDGRGEVFNYSGTKIFLELHLFLSEHTLAYYESTRSCCQQAPRPGNLVLLACFDIYCFKEERP